jgi:protein-tyrosine-phosphatase
MRDKNIDHEARILREVEALALEFEGIFGIETIRRCATESLERFENATVREFVPLLVRKFTRDRLNATAQAAGLISKDKPEVLFVCVHNAGRSQMAAALTAKLSEGRVHVRSAGSTPASEINAAVVEAMAEVGIDISEEFPKPLVDEFVQAADVVITMGCGDACPIYPGKRYEDWSVSDPAGQQIDVVRGIRDDISRRVLQLLKELGVVAQASTS